MSPGCAGAGWPRLATGGSTIVIGASADAGACGAAAAACGGAVCAGVVCPDAGALAGGRAASPGAAAARAAAKTAEGTIKSALRRSRPGPKFQAPRTTPISAFSRLASLPVFTSVSRTRRTIGSLVLGAIALAENQSAETPRNSGIGPFHSPGALGGSAASERRG